MKIKISFIFTMLILCAFGLQKITAQNLVENVSITADEANFQMIAPNAYLMEIAGPNGYYFKEKVAHTNQISISNAKKDGSKFGDGLYQLQITPLITLAEDERTALAKLRAEGNLEKIATFRMEHNLPDEVAVHNIYFSVKNGAFVNPDQKEYSKVKMPTSAYTWEQDHPAMYASLNEVTTTYGQPTEGHSSALAKDNSNLSEDDQVFLDDVIVDGSICVGQDCVNGESFGFDTQRIKENNLRIHFNDTSSSASFPSNDWRITINDSSNGGSNYFAVEDATAGTIPFRVEAGAGNNALHVDASGGNVGMGTATPVVELHVTDGDSPTMRLEQNGSNGWTPQTWDIAGNETNFFVRDVTNGSKLPFKIRPGAPDNSIYVDAEGDIGIGTANPGTNGLQLENGNLYVKAGNLGVNVDPGAFALNVLGPVQYTGSTIHYGDPTVFMTNGGSFFNADFTTLLRLDAAGKKVGINTLVAPAYELQVCGTIATSAMTVETSISCSSDIRFKKNIETLSGSLDKVMQLRGVSYDWKTEGFPNKKFNDVHQLGFIAQEIETIIPELVSHDAEGYKAVDYNKLTPVLVEAIKEQQKIINEQQAEIDELKALKAQVASLSQMVSELTEKEAIEVEEVISEKK